MDGPWRWHPPMKIASRYASVLSGRALGVMEWAARREGWFVVTPGVRYWRCGGCGGDRVVNGI